ncbi:MAG: prephenate dehydrogenase/arogenate dehydrogenase family protein [Deltaproteobacteria bacterium]|nr:prephenate dehydrogenase/arogenate dehydrogenase family protein [Deltaproteobacteria bacterium]
MEPFFKKVAIIGVGLIGGSLCYTLKDKKLAGTIVGVGRGEKNLKTAVSMGLIDSYTHDVNEGVKDADLVVVCVPVKSIASIVSSFARNLKPGAIVTDVGSVKEEVVKAVEPLMPKGAHFVAAHPIAGTENSGAEFAVRDLYVKRKCILTPTDKTDKEALQKVRALWEAAGSEVVIMDAKTHDIALAAISHLPHVIAYSLVNAIEDIDEEIKDHDILKYTAGGFKDFTRIASSSPEMWADICDMNKAAILSTIEKFERVLTNIKGHISKGEYDAIKADFQRAKDIRDALKK